MSTQKVDFDIDDLKREQRIQEALRRAETAEKILKDPEISGAWEAIRTKVCEKLEATELSGDPATERYALELTRVLQANARHRRIFENYVQTGKLLEAELLYRPGGEKH